MWMINASRMSNNFKIVTNLPHSPPHQNKSFKVLWTMWTLHDDILGNHNIIQTVKISFFTMVFHNIFHNTVYSNLVCCKTTTLRLNPGHKSNHQSYATCNSNTHWNSL